ncbi:MAG: FABP family protein [Acidimicrobiia bacterium]|nr:FABP family protein [Acidimicrobiia bacterium]
MSLDRLSFLLGTWRGEGRGEYPTIEDFTYTEEVVFGSIPGKPFVTYLQRTKGADGAPLHTESGYVRSPAEGVVELVVAQPTGITEVLSGTLDGQHLDLTSTEVGVAPTAVEVNETARRIWVEGDTLRYALDMEAVGQPMAIHLEATLHRDT